MENKTSLQILRAALEEIRDCSQDYGPAHLRPRYMARIALEAAARAPGLADDAKGPLSVKCPACCAEVGESCWLINIDGSEQYGEVICHYARLDAEAAKLNGEKYASSHCPLCGLDSPHAHSKYDAQFTGYVSVVMPAIFAATFNIYQQRHRSRIAFFIKRAIDDYLAKT